MFSYNLTQFFHIYATGASIKTVLEMLNEKVRDEITKWRRRVYPLFHDLPYPLTIPRGTKVFSSLLPRSLRFFFPLPRNDFKNVSESSRRVSNSGLRSIKELASYCSYDHRSISTAP